MIWLGIGLGVAVLALLVIVVAVRRRGEQVDGIDDVDPLFTTGIVLTGAGVALATTLGPLMYGMMTIGLIVMAVGANRTRHHHGHH
jgi:hypothetical protein